MSKIVDNLTIPFPVNWTIAASILPPCERMEHWNSLPRYLPWKTTRCTSRPSELAGHLSITAIHLFWLLFISPCQPPAYFTLLTRLCEHQKTWSCQATTTKVHISSGWYTYSYFSSIYNLLSTFFIMHWELGHSIQSSVATLSAIIWKRPFYFITIKAPNTIASLGMSPVASIRS